MVWENCVYRSQRMKRGHLKRLAFFVYRYNNATLIFTYVEYWQYDFYLPSLSVTKIFIVLLLTRLKLCLCSSPLHTFYKDVVCAVLFLFLFVFLFVHTMCFGFPNHTAGLSKAIGCNKYREPVCVSVIVQLNFSGLMQILFLFAYQTSLSPGSQTQCSISVFPLLQYV